MPAVLGAGALPCKLERHTDERKGARCARRLILVSCVIFSALALAAPGSGAYLQSAHLTVLTERAKPTWKVDVSAVPSAPGRLRAEVSEFSYRQGAKFRTLQVWTWGRKTHSRERSGRCAWYHSETHRSRFPQRAGWVSGVTLEIFDPSGRRSPGTSACTPEGTSAVEAERRGSA